MAATFPGANVGDRRHGPLLHGCAHICSQLPLYILENVSP